MEQSKMEAAYRSKAEGIIKGSLGGLLGMTVDEASEGRCVVRMPAEGEVQNGAGRVHGGAITALIDNAATAAAWAYKGLRDDAWGTTISLTCNFQGPGKTADLIADARVTQRGRSTVFVEIHVTDEDDRTIAQGLVTYKLNPGT
jgi:acyl-CoA thioesterase